MPKSVDANQRDIVEALRMVGASVITLHEVGRGCPDILAGRNGRNYLMEIKSPERRNRLTPSQKEFHARWDGQVDIVTSIDEALTVVGVDLPRVGELCRHFYRTKR